MMSAAIFIPQIPPFMDYRNFKKHVVPFLLLSLLWLVPVVSYAQMFSVDKGPERHENSSIGIYGGLEPIVFSYKGPSVSGALDGRYDFKGTLLRFLFEGPGINLFVGTGGKLTGLKDVSYFDAGIRAGYGLILYHNRRINLALPLLIESTYTTVSDEKTIVTGRDNPEFQQGTLQFGTGLEVNARLAPNFRLKVNAVPSYGFSFAVQSGNSGGGIFSAKGKIRTYFEHLFGSAGLSLGYTYHFRKYNINDNTLDYNATTNSFLIGVMF